jgi:hypothetical protein
MLEAKAQISCPTTSISRKRRASGQPAAFTVHQPRACETDLTTLSMCFWRGTYQNGVQRIRAKTAGRVISVEKSKSQKGVQDTLEALIDTKASNAARNEADVPTQPGGIFKLPKRSDSGLPPKTQRPDQLHSLRCAHETWLGLCMRTPAPDTPFGSGIQDIGTVGKANRLTGD